MLHTTVTPSSVYAISHDYGHHARRSGYARLEEYLGRIMSVYPIPNAFAARLMTKINLHVRENLVRRAYMPMYRLQHLSNEASVIQMWLTRRGCIFHHLYGEESYRYTGNLKRLGGLGKDNFLVATYHLPPTQLERVLVARNHVSRLDRIIVVGSSQIEFFRGLVDDSKIACIPHGVDIDYFKPSAQRAIPDVVTCLCVGHLQRDFGTLLAVAWILKLENVAAKIVVVDAQFDMPHFSSLDNVEVKCGITDADLLETYQNADLLLLPLNDCTANNALLEAMACGLPIVTSRVGSVMDYVNDGCALITPSADPRAMADAVIGLAQHRELRREMGRAARRHAEKYAWAKIARQVKDLYREMVSK